MFASLYELAAKISSLKLKFSVSTRKFSQRVNLLLDKYYFLGFTKKKNCVIAYVYNDGWIETSGVENLRKLKKKFGKMKWKDVST